MLVYVAYCRDLVWHDGVVALEGLWQHTLWCFPTLARDVHNCPLANYITTPSSNFAEVETSLNVNKFMRLCSSSHVQDFLQQKKYIAWMAGITQNTQLQYYTPTHSNTQVPVSISACIYEVLIQWYIFSYYFTGLHKYCIVNVKDCNTSLYILVEVLWPWYSSSHMRPCTIASM